MDYIIDYKRTLDVFNERLTAYKNAIEKANSLARLTHVLEGFTKLTKEWVYVAGILSNSSFGTTYGAFKTTRKLYEVLAIAETKFMELYSKGEIES